MCVYVCVGVCVNVCACGYEGEKYRETERIIFESWNDCLRTETTETEIWVTFWMAVRMAVKKNR